ncbi:Hypothetical predicted protein, partial [Paramuricea clavata]
MSQHNEGYAPDKVRMGHLEQNPEVVLTGFSESSKFRIRTQMEKILLVVAGILLILCIVFIALLAKESSSDDDSSSSSSNSGRL